MYLNYYNRVLLLMITLCFSSLCEAQTTGNITGKIINKSTKQVIPFASVSLKGTNQGMMADSAGNFSLLNLNEGVYSILISSVGFQVKTVNDVRIIRNKTNYLEIEQEPSSTILEEVKVGTKVFRFENNPLTPVSTFGFSREEIARNPGAQGDIFRAIGMLPGVSSSGGAFSAIAVRGQGTRENVYMVDDIPMLQLGHLDGSPNGFSDPNGARFSIFAPRVITNAQFQGGGFAAQYGRQSASFLALSIKEGNKKDFTIDGQADLYGLTVNYDGPSHIQKNTSLFISARYQNFTQALKLVSLSHLGIPSYADFILKSTTDINAKNKLSIIALYNPENFTRTVDNVIQDKELNNLALVDYKNNKMTFAASLRTLLGKASYWKNIIYHTRTQYDAYYGLAFPKVNLENRLMENTVPSVQNALKAINYQEQEIGYRSILTTNFKGASLVVGFDFNRISLDNTRKLNGTDTLYVFGKNDFRPNASAYYSIVQPQYFDTDYHNFAYNASAYADISQLFFHKLTLNAGLRYDYTGFTEQHSLSPRLSGNWQLDETNSLNFATGIFYQNPLYADVADQPKAEKLQNEKIVQFIVGYKKYFTPDLKLTVEAWYKTLDNLVVRPITGAINLNNAGIGWAEGVDVSLVKRLSDKIHGQVSYSYMQSKRDDKDGQGEYDFTFSQPHQVNFLLVYKHNQHWTLSSKFRYATGKPANKYLIHSDIFNDKNRVRYSAEIIEKNTKRLPDFMSIDLRADYTFNIKKYHFTAFVDIVNTLNRQNQNQELFNSINGKTYYDGVAILPSSGLRFEF